MNLLKRNRVDTIGKMIHLSEKEIASMRNAGNKTIEEVLAVIDKTLPLVERETHLIHGDEDNAHTGTLNNPEGTDDERITPSLLTMRVEDMNISARLKNALRSIGIFTYGDIESISKYRPDKIQGLDARDLNELREIRQKAIRLKRRAALWKQADELVSEFLNSGNPFYTDEVLGIRKELYFRTTTMLDHKSITIQEAINSDFFDDLFRRALLNELQNNFVVTSRSLTTVFKGGLSPLRDSYIKHWIENGFLYEEQDHYVLYYPSAMERAQVITNERIREVVILRLKGSTLEYIGNIVGISRERVRQIVHKHFMNSPKVMEDRFAVLFEKYCFNRDSFSLITALPIESYEYLNIRYKKGKLDLNGILSEDLPEHMLANAQKYIDDIRQGTVYNKEHSSEVLAILNDYLATNDFNLNDRKWLLQNNMIRLRIQELNNAWEIFEVSENRFVTERFLETRGINPSMLLDYCQRVSRFTKGQIFTMQYLETSGFVNPYNEYGMSDLFWLSVLTGSGLFEKQRLGKQTILRQGTANHFNSNQLIKDIVQRYGSIKVTNLLNLLESDYGIVINNDKTILLAKKAGLLYSPENRTICVSYEMLNDEL